MIFLVLIFVALVVWAVLYFGYCMARVNKRVNGTYAWWKWDK